MPSSSIQNLSLFPPDSSSSIPPPSYNLRFEPWIPIVGSDGKRREVGLEDALLQAHEWRAISDPLPTVEFGLYRLLVALVLDIFEPRNTVDWSELWDEGRFDTASVRAYFEKHDGAFDLFSPSRPFLQNVMPDDAPKPLAGLVHPVPSGSATNHFHHEHEDDFAVSPAIAAGLLTTIAPWMTAGGAGLSPSINGAPPWYVLPMGKSGFETLLLNCPVVADLMLAQGDKEVHWRQSSEFASGEQSSASLLQSLTWRPRRVQLVPQTNGGICSLSGRPCEVLVSNMKFAPGWSTRFDWIDPNAAYRVGTERKIVRSREGREVWRDSGPLALLRDTSNAPRETRYERPAIITQLVQLRGNDYIERDQPLDIAIYGMRTDMKMKVFEWHKERLRLPMRLTLDNAGANEAQNAIELAEEVAYAVKRSVKATYPREGKGNDDAFQSLCDNASRAFWRDLRAPYNALLDQLASASDQLASADSDEMRGAARASWRETLRAQGWKTLREAIDDLDGDAELLRRQTNAYSLFSRALGKLLRA